MRYLNKRYHNRKIVDSKDWLDEEHDEVAERALMKRKMLARRKAEEMLKAERELKAWFDETP